MKRTAKRRCIAGLLVVALSAGALPPQALAEVVATDAVVAASARDRVALALSRAEVQQRLAAYGVDRAQAQARVDALSDDEAAQLAERLDALPAGGDGIVGTILFVFILLLLTDILGFTKVFPFTRSIK